MKTNRFRLIYKDRVINKWMKQEGMTFDHDFCYFILLFSSLLKKEGREKEKDVAKIVIKSHTFLFHQQMKQKIYTNNGSSRKAFILLFFFPLLLGWKRKGDKYNQSHCKKNNAFLLDPNDKAKKIKMITLYYKEQ